MRCDPKPALRATYVLAFALRRATTPRSPIVPSDGGAESDAAIIPLAAAAQVTFASGSGLHPPEQKHLGIAKLGEQTTPMTAGIIQPITRAFLERLGCEHSKELYRVR
jgi:hypothetical protein